MSTSVVIDVGATWIRGGIAISDMPRVAIQSQTPRTANGIVDTICSVGRELARLADGEVTRFMIAVPGLVCNDGTIAHAGLLGIRDLSLRQLLEEKFQVQCRVFNDASAQAFGVVQDNRESLLYLSIGSGIGGALIAAGQLYHGCGFGGEFGHLQVDTKYKRMNKICYCGRRRCLELVSSGEALRARLGESWWRLETNMVAHVLDEAANAVADVLDLLAVALDPARIHVSSNLCSRAPFRERIVQNLYYRNYPRADRNITFSDDPTIHTLVGLMRLSKNI